MLKGSLEILLLSLLLKKDCYGYEMIKELRELSGGSYNMNEGTMYPALKRLEKNECIIAYWTEEENEKRRKYYTITENGRKVLSSKKRNWNELNLLMKKVSEGYS